MSNTAEDAQEHTGPEEHHPSASLCARYKSSEESFQRLVQSVPISENPVIFLSKKERRAHCKEKTVAYHWEGQAVCGKQAKRQDLHQGRQHTQRMRKYFYFLFYKFYIHTHICTKAHNKTLKKS